jgi:hypothetical protein
MHFKKWQKHWKWRIHTEGDYLRGMVAGWPKVGFDQMAATVPEIMDCFFCSLLNCNTNRIFQNIFPQAAYVHIYNVTKIRMQLHGHGHHYGSSESVSML